MEKLAGAGGGFVNANNKEVGGHRWTGAGGVGESGLDHVARMSPREQHWHLLRDEMADLVERAVQKRAKEAAFEHRGLVQEFWLKDWTHQGLTLNEAAQQVIKGKRDSEWAREWFNGYSMPYLDQSVMSIPGALRALGRAHSLFTPPHLRALTRRPFHRSPPVRSNTYFTSR